MRALTSWAILAALLATSCAELITISDVIELQVDGDEPSDALADDLRTAVYRESDGQLVVQVFNEGPDAVRDVELEIERVSRSGRRTVLGNASIHRRIGAGSMDQTRTSVFVDKREVKHVEVRVTSAEPAG
jgi:hypothetical protein